MGWSPPQREPWVESVNALGANLGDEGASMISLEPDAVVAAARAVTGLHDMGAGGWAEALDTLCASLRDEARLTFAGRILARAELQRIAQSRLRLLDQRAREPSIGDEVVVAPVVVTGLGRSGTTFLHELLAQDPANRVPLLWEAMYPVPPPETASYHDDPRIAAAHREISVMDEMVPAFTAMHENAGWLPTECIFVFAHEFVTDMFLGQYNCPTYAVWQSGVDRAAQYAFHRQFLQVLQWRCPGDRWVLKAPSHLSRLAALFATYPDARVVITHRDPLRVIGSLADLMAALQWMRSDHVDYDAIVALLAFGVGYEMDNVSAERDAGGLPERQITDVLYRDLVDDPAGTVRRLYDAWGLEMTPAFADRLDRYLAERRATRSSGPGHEYAFADTGLDLGAERDRLAPYMARFDVPLEVT